MPSLLCRRGDFWRMGRCSLFRPLAGVDNDEHGTLVLGWQRWAFSKEGAGSAESLHENQAQNHIMGYPPSSRVQPSALLRKKVYLVLANHRESAGGFQMMYMTPSGRRPTIMARTCRRGFCFSGQSHCSLLPTLRRIHVIRHCQFRFYPGGQTQRQRKGTTKESSKAFNKVSTI